MGLERNKGAPKYQFTPKKKKKKVGIILLDQQSSTWVFTIESNTIGTVADVEAVYGLDGKRCDGMKSGMNIIRMSDGTTRKIVKWKKAPSPTSPRGIKPKSAISVIMITADIFEQMYLRFEGAMGFHCYR